MDKKTVKSPTYLGFIAFLSILVITLVNSLFHMKDIDPKEDASFVLLTSLLFMLLLYFILDYLFLYERKGLRIAFAIASSVLIILGAEYTLRYFQYIHPRVFRYNPYTLWEIYPNLTGVTCGEGKFEYKLSTNSLGFRSGEISIQKPKGEYRILILGDSATFGWPLNDRENYPYFLEKILRLKYPHKNIRVINAAVPGYTTFQGVQFLKEKGWSLSPNLIIVAFNNDITFDFVKDSQKLPKGKPSLLKELHKSYLYQFLKEKIYKVRINPEDDITVTPNKGVRRVSREEEKLLYQYILNTAKKRKVPVIVLSLPVEESFQNFPEFIKYRQIMEMETHKEGGFFLDLLSVWNQQNTENLFIDVMHPNIEGHKKIAREIAEFIIKHNLIEEDK